MIDPYGQLARLHAQELRRVADERRLRRLATHRRPSLLMRVYARLWWASRPRVGSWAPALVDPRY